MAGQLPGGRPATRAETTASIRAEAVKVGLAWGAAGAVLGGVLGYALVPVRRAPGFETRAKRTAGMATAGAVIFGTVKAYRHWKRESWVLDAFYGPEQTGTR